MPFDLRLDARALASALSERFEAKRIHDEDDVFSAFLLGGGLYQVVEDWSHRESFVLRRTARVQSAAPPPVGSLARVAGRIAVGASAVSRLTPRGAAAARSGKALMRLVEELACAAVDPGDTRAFEEARRSWERLRPSVARYPESLLQTVLRLPDPFYRFDQSVADCRALVERFAERWPDCGRSLLVVGVRASGSYLAPLYRALLLDRGYRRVETLTVRPRQRWRRGEVARLHAATAADGLIVVVDDPPATGSAVARVARELERHGVPDASIVLVLSLFGPESSLPASLQPFSAVVLPWREWSIHAQLTPGAVLETLSRTLVGRKIVMAEGTEIRVAAVESVERLDAAGTSAAAEGRRHASGSYRATFLRDDGETIDQRIVVTGLGPAYYGDRARALASVLEGFVEPPLAIDRGLLYERYVEPESRVRPPIAPGLVDRFVSYVLHRRDALEVDADRSLRAPDDQMVWRMAADALGKALGGPFRALAYPVTHVASRRLLRVSRPAVTDGNLALSTWSVVPESPDRPLKTDWLGRLNCYDAAFDLATVAASADVEQLVHGSDVAEQPLGGRLLATYRRRTGEQIDAERWLLYQLVENNQRLAYLARQFRASDEEDRRAAMSRWLATRRALAGEYQRYISGVFFSDLEVPTEGPLCAFDVDWVLETRWLEFPAIAPAGALALRALLRHGYRPVIVTARSLGEVRDRCRVYRLAGGVAEFGSVVYDARGDRVLPQVAASGSGELTRLRYELERLPGVYLDPGHDYSVRAVRVTANGSVRGLQEETIQAALDAGGLEDRVRVFRGGGQTDFVVASVDKGTGLRALADALDVAPDARPVAFAMGDDWPDSPMFDLARARFAPANISADLRNELHLWPDLNVTRDPYGSGALQAVAAFIGHKPARCPECAPPRLADTERILVTALGGLDGPRRRRIRQAASLALLLARAALREGRGRSRSERQLG